jgi:site-specific DNA-cytosine methylase
MVVLGLGSSGLVEFMLEAIRVKTTMMYSSDPKKAAISFCAANLRAEHHFLSLTDSTKAKAFCEVHGGECQNNPGDIDMFIAGFPCAPYSRMRAKRSSTGFHCNVVINGSKHGHAPTTNLFREPSMVFGDFG